MMKVVQINATCGVGSTGKICVGISQLLSREKIENYILYSSLGNGCKEGIKCSADKYIKLQALKSRVFGNYGFNSKKATGKIINEIQRIDPDVVHLHNIHGHDCDLEMLLEYFRENKTKLIWTFHDCWTFTGYCTYFSMSGCDKWKDQCGGCPQKKTYSWFFDKSSELFQKKKKLFEGLDLTIVTPSKWLADMVKESFLKKYPVQVIYNGIDLETFRPQSEKFRREYGLENKKIVLGVSVEWGERKGLDVFNTMAQKLSDEYQIVLVGTNPQVDKMLAENIISIHRTENQQKLAEIYTAADVFANPTRDEVLGLVNIESLACGTPVVTFESGGSPECIDETCGITVKCDDTEDMIRQIEKICSEKPFSEKDCIRYAENFDKEKNFGKYVELYKEICFDRITD